MLPGSCGINNYFYGDYMNESDYLRKEIKSLRAELDAADEIHFDEIQEAERYNNLMTVLVIVLDIWVVTLL